MTDLIIDHVLIAVRDLDAAKDTFERLGFKVTPEGRHPGRGTSNRLVVFGGEYLELISVHDPEGDLFRPNLPSFWMSARGCSSSRWGRRTYIGARGAFGKREC